MNSIFKTALAASIAYTTHFGVVKVYNEMCVPDGFWGFFQGAITTGSPICNGLFTVMSQSQVSYNAIILTSLSYLFVDGLQAILSSGKQRRAQMERPDTNQEETPEETQQVPKVRRRY
jgi:hypothetical protein